MKLSKFGQQNVDLDNHTSLCIGCLNREKKILFVVKATRIGNYLFRKIIISLSQFNVNYVINVSIIIYKYLDNYIQVLKTTNVTTLVISPKQHSSNLLYCAVSSKGDPALLFPHSQHHESRILAKNIFILTHF